MTEPAEALRTLIERPTSPPEAMEELHERVAARRRRRSRRRLSIGGLATVAVAIVIVPSIERPTDPATRVVAGGDAGFTATTAGPGLPSGVGGGTRLDFQVPEGWQILFADGDRMVVATRPLSDPDLELALLARDDVSFVSFPPDGVVVAVGGDPLDAKYRLRPDGTTLGPGPDYALGDERVLAGGVRVRRGDVPQSIVRIASYAGPSAPDTHLQEAEAIASGLRLLETGDPLVRPPPPPEGSRPGLESGPLPVAEQGLQEVARTPSSGSTLLLVAGHDCAYLRWVDADPELPEYQPLAGACGPRPTRSNLEALAPAVQVGRGPQTSPSTAVIVRVGPDVRSVSARLADGRSARGVLGSDGWGVVASDGRIVVVTGLDSAGRQVPEVVVD